MRRSYVRQALYGQRWLHDRFGVTATTGSNVDPFGHNAMLPQLLRKSETDSYVFLRPGPNGSSCPVSTSGGSRRTARECSAYRIPHEYCSPRGDIDQHVEKALAQVPAEGPALMVFYGVGNHGGGPTKANIESIRRLEQVDERNTAGRVRSPGRSSTPLLADDIPVRADELLHHAVGCYRRTRA